MAPFSNDDDRWVAVVRRDRRADGIFYYSVLTTGVYCRPSCPSRLARQENVSFHASCEAAEKAGFRPCKRCRPNEPPLVERRAAAVAKVCRLIEKAEEMPSLDALAEAVGMSRFHFHRVFKIVTGVTPKAYAATLRAGFNSSEHFYAKSSEALGMIPKRFRSGGGGELIRFAVGQCSLGSILVASTEKGVCAIWFGDDRGTLVRDLRDSFPKAELIGGDRDFEQLVAKVVSFVVAPAQDFDLRST